MGPTDTFVRKKLGAFIAWGAEAAIVAGLVWKQLNVFGGSGPFLLVLAFPLFCIFHWLFLAKRNHLDRSRRLTLFVLTGPSALLSLFLVFELTAMLRTVVSLGGMPKEMVQVEVREVKRDCDECYEQWSKDTVARMKSELLIYGMLFANSCLLYASRFSAKTVDVEPKAPGAI